MRSRMYASTRSGSMSGISIGSTGRMVPSYLLAVQSRAIVTSRQRGTTRPACSNGRHIVAWPGSRPAITSRTSGRAIM
jgi:hypothetical protein